LNDLKFTTAGDYMSDAKSEYKDIETVKHSFVVRDNDEAKFTAIRIDEGKFKDTVYLYEEVQVGKETDEGGLNLHFNVKVAQCPNDNPFDFEEEFHNVCGDILISCLEKGLRKEDEVDIIYRNHDSQSLAQQRELQSEGITISED
tara:strand:+ start:336 stop:770 length:435 start_codon:yes stop_codon:yes gene_type:complete